MDNTNLDELILAKQKELDARKAALESYARNCGRDRWFNRGCHDVTTIQAELDDLLAQRGPEMTGPTLPEA